MRDSAGEISRKQILKNGLRESLGIPLKGIKEDIINILYFIKIFLSVWWSKDWRGSRQRSRQKKMN